MTVLAGRGDVPVVECMGVPITAHTPETAARHVIQLALQHRVTRSSGPTTDAPPGTDVHLCNAYTLALADRDPELHGILRRSGLNLPDGQPVVWANQLLHRRAQLPNTRTCGPELFLDVFALGQVAGIRHYLLGSTPHVLDALQRELRRRFPQALIVGAHSPPFRPLSVRERHDQDRDILASGADIVWVGLGTPKQDVHATALASGLPVVCAAVGAAFDFVAGHKRRAPRWMRSSGLEWIFRLFCEPRRLWRRYLFGNARFLWGVARQTARDAVQGAFAY
ncbi:WecB/TagA/CpsF family glycosyltransferase [Streptomyces sp. NBC_01537]|uniref:WecB/TagA/CpsF family glycosyltransferase n=1 Tax=Streptomyces sp. NBC_01537 TaxID=2903896 RepID=UPI0038676F45